MSKIKLERITTQITTPDFTTVQHQKKEIIFKNKFKINFKHNIVMLYAAQTGTYKAEFELITRYITCSLWVLLTQTNNITDITTKSQKKTPYH